MATENVVIVIIDGARYSETLGDTAHTYVPYMGNLTHQGAYVDQFYNDSLTYTSRAIPALWCGTWTEVRDTTYNGQNTRYAVKPTLFEYFRKQAAAPAENCIYVLKFINSLWLPSFNANYGPGYWPLFHSQGSTDEDVLVEALGVISTFHPRLLWIYLADVDGAGHSGNWQAYTRAIQIADSIVGVIWSTIQSDSYYMNNTTMFVTNDHGRHDDAHGGFQGHGDGCDGCRHIMFLTVGPRVKQDFVSSQYRRTPDLAVTASAILGVNPEYATGEYISEIFEPLDVKSGEKSRPVKDITLFQNYPNPFNPATRIKYTIAAPAQSSSGRNIRRYQPVTLTIYDLQGRAVKRLVSEYQLPGSYSVDFDGSELFSGIYFYTLQVGNYRITKKMLIIH
ncbi:MAG: T9SS type A sorting domain-containing protein [Calditrichia bacterium]